MLYINALELINLAIEHGVLEEKDGGVFVKRGEPKKGWHLSNKDSVAKELRIDKHGQEALITALKKLNVTFIPKDYGINEKINNEN